MPPSPAVRVSHPRELRTQNHKRGHSLESGILYREKEDDLALFNEVQNKQRENFLLQSNDDFDDPFSTKLRYFSDYKLGISVPSQGESSGLLNAEGDKNDYDWLITPPETPLFPSLDDDAPVNLAPWGRASGRPVSISRSPMMEKSDRRGRGSASPRRLSPSPPSSNSVLHSRSRPFSATHSSPSPTMSPSPSRRLSPPLSKQSPASRSTTPIPTRMSTGSAGTTDRSRVRGTSPVKASRGNSTSPKTRVLQYNNPGFSSEAPPNLQTSLADRLATYVRGSSPASKNGSRYGRQSMSPTASRNDLDSLQSIPVASSDRSAPRGSINFSKKPSKILSSSAPKRSIDLDWQMDRRAPQNMFRPLLSSVPRSTFHVGNTNTHHHSLTSRNSSITASTIGSFDQSTSGAHGTEVSGHNQEDGASDCVKECYPDVNDEVFVKDQADGLNEDAENRIMGDTSEVSSSLHVAGSSNQLGITTTMHTAIVKLDKERVCSHGDGNPDMVICSKCGLMFHSADIEGDEQVCRECNNLEVNSTITSPLKGVMVGENDTTNFVQILEHGSLEVLERSSSIPKSLQVTCVGEMVVKRSADENQHSFSDSGQNLSTGSFLLKRLSSGKGHFVQSRSFTASNTSFDNFSCTKDSVNSLRSSIEHSCSSVSSSFDLGSSRQTEIRIHRQSNGQNSDVENYRHKRSLSSLSGASSHMFQVPSVKVIAAHMDKDVREEICTYPREQSLAADYLEAETMCTDIESSSIFKNASELSSHSMNVHSGDSSVVSVITSQDPGSHENGEDLTINSGNLVNAETSSAHSHTFIQEEGATPSSFAGKGNVPEVPHLSSLDSVSETEIGDVDAISANSSDSTNAKGHKNKLQQNDVITATVEEFDFPRPAHEESVILLDDTGGSGTEARSLTLDEATDTILFCSSIVHNLAHQAADIATDNENLPMEALQPTVTFVGKSHYERRDMHLRTTGKRSSKSQKARQKKLEVQTVSPPSSNAIETDDKSSRQRIVGAHKNGEGMKPPQLESKCNCIIM